MTGEKLRAEWFWLDRWFSSSACCLPIDARGLYRELLSRAWSMGAKLPKNEGMLQRLAGVTINEWDRLWPLVQPYWKEQDGHLVNDTQLEIYADAMQRKQVRVDRARKGADARWSKAREESEQCSSNAQASAKQCPPSPSPSLSPEQSPKEKQPCADKSARFVYPPGFERFWKAYKHRGARGSKRDALGFWKRDKLEGRADEIIALLPAFEATRDWQRGCQHAAERFLKKRLWESPPAAERDNGRPDTAKPLDPSHPCHGHKRGETWADAEGTKHAILKDGMYWRKKSDCERECMGGVL